MNLILSVSLLTRSTWGRIYWCEADLIQCDQCRIRSYHLSALGQSSHFWEDFQHILLPKKLLLSGGPSDNGTNVERENAGDRNRVTDCRALFTRSTGKFWVLTCETINHYISLQCNATNLCVMRGCVLSVRGWWWSCGWSPA